MNSAKRVPSYQVSVGKNGLYFVFTTATPLSLSVATQDVWSSSTTFTYKNKTSKAYDPMMIFKQLWNSYMRTVKEKIMILITEFER